MKSDISGRLISGKYLSLLNFKLYWSNTMRELSENGKLRKQLSALTKTINTEGLLFLIEQANIIKYNAEVEKANNSAVTSKTKRTETKVSIKSADDFVIEAEKDKSNFIFIMRNSRKFLTRDEMRSVVKISSEKRSANLYRYFLKERSDILKDCSIKSQNDPILKKMIEIISTKYKSK